MARNVLSGLIQASNPINDETKSVARDPGGDMLEKHLPMIHDAGKKGVQILCLQRRSSTARTSARGKTSAGTTRPSPCPDRPSRGCGRSPRSTRWC